MRENYEHEEQYDSYWEHDDRCECHCPPKRLTHVHEVQGSVRLAEFGDDRHSHRFAGLSDEVVRVNGGHIHELSTKTDFYENHFHEICVRSGLQIPVGDGRHVHFIDDCTGLADGHKHEFIVATLIENPIEEECE